MLHHSFLLKKFSTVCICRNSFPDLFFFICAQVIPTWFFLIALFRNKLITHANDSNPIARSIKMSLNNIQLKITQETRTLECRHIYRTAITPQIYKLWQFKYWMLEYRPCVKLPCPISCKMIHGWNKLNWIEFNLIKCHAVSAIIPSVPADACLTFQFWYERRGRQYFSFFVNTTF
jgi:hypothetical protein